MLRLNTILAACVIAAPALAADQVFPTLAQRAVQGHVDLYAGYGQLSWPYSYWTVGGAGRLNIPLRQDWNLQLDPQAVGVHGEDGGKLTDIAGYVHLYRRGMTSAAGVYGGYDRLDNFSLPINVVTVGIEGQRYGQALTFYGQGALSHMTIPYCGSCRADGAMVRGELQRYFGANTIVAADLIGTHLWGDLDTANVFSAILGVIHRFDGSQFGLFGRVRYDNYHNSHGSFDDWRVVAGVRYFADQPGATLRSHLLTGPAMSVEPLPTYWVDTCVWACASDVRLKRDIALLERLPNGLGIYRFRYLWSDTVWVGVMAQEVAALAPAAVIGGADGYLRVNYGALGLAMTTWDNWLARRAGGLVATALPAGAPAEAAAR